MRNKSAYLGISWICRDSALLLMKRYHSSGCNFLQISRIAFDQRKNKSLK